MDIDIKEYYKNYYKENKEHMQELFKKRRERNLGNYIYLICNYNNIVIYAGSTTDIDNRISNHLNGFSSIKDYADDIYKVLVAEVEEDITREELFFVEQIYIDRFRDTLINCRDSYKNDYIDRKEYLINLAYKLNFTLYKVEGIKADGYVDFRREEEYINTINICGSEIEDEFIEIGKQVLNMYQELKDKEDATIEELIEFQDAFRKLQVKLKLYIWFKNKIKNDYKRLVYI